MKRSILVLVIGLTLLFGVLGTPAIGASKVVEISVQDVWADSLMWGRVWLETIATFEKENPDIKINRIYVPLGQNIERILLQTKTASLPDVITCDTQDVPHLAEAGALQDLSKFVEDWGKWDDVLPGSRSAVSWDGKPYAMQFSTNTIALHYNRDHFDEVGLAGPPETWDELKLWAQKLTKGDRYGFALSAFSSEEATWHFLPFLWSNGGDLLDLTSPKSVEALEFITSFVKDGCMSPDVVNWNQGDVGVQFRLGKASMIVQGCWDIPLSEEANMNFAVAQIPPPQKGMPTIAPVGGEPFGISPFSSKEKQAAAWRFLEWLMEREGMIFFNSRVNNIPTRASVAPAVTAEKPLLQPFLEELKNGRNRFEYGGGAKYPNVSVATREAIQRAIVGAATPKDAFETAAEAIDKILSK